MKKLTVLFVLVLLTSNFVFSQIGINTDGSLPNGSAGLDVKFSNKGLLIPQIALSGTDDAITIANPATSLLIYNTATAGTILNNVLPGFYYNGGTPASPVWKRLATDPNSTNDSGSQGLIIKLPNAVMKFGQDVPMGTILIDVNTSKEYLALVPLLSTDNILESQYYNKVKEISNATHTGDVNGIPNSDILTIGADKVLTGMIKDGEVQTNDIKDNTVTLGKIEKITSGFILGNFSGIDAAPQPLLIGGGLFVSAGTLNSSSGTLQTVTKGTANGLIAEVTYPTTDEAHIEISGANLTPATVVASNYVKGKQLWATTTAPGTAPFVVSSTVPVANLSIGGNAASATTAATAGTATNITGGLGGSLPYQTGDGATGFVPIGTTGQVLQVNSGLTAPEWKTLTSIERKVKALGTNASITWNIDADGPNATILLTKNTTILLTSPAIGTSGSLTVTSNGAWTLKLDYTGNGGSNVRYAPDIFTGASGARNVSVTSNSSTASPTTADVYNWYYDGTTVYWSGKLGYRF